MRERSVTGFPGDIRQAANRTCRTQRRTVRRAPRGGGGLAAAREPPLEVDVAHGEVALRPVRLGVDPADQLAGVEDRQRVVAVHALGAGRVDLDAIAEAEEPLDALAVPEERVERRQERRAAGPLPAAGGAGSV